MRKFFARRAKIFRILFRSPFHYWRIPNSPIPRDDTNRRFVCRLLPLFISYFKIGEFLIRRYLLFPVKTPVEREFIDRFDHYLSVGVGAFWN